MLKEKYEIYSIFHCVQLNVCVDRIIQCVFRFINARNVKQNNVEYKNSESYKMNILTKRINGFMLENL